MTGSSEVGDQPERPVLRVVGGNPTPEEVAVLTVVLTALGGAPAAPAPAPVTGGWADPSRRLRRPLAPGPGAWSASARY